MSNKGLNIFDESAAECAHLRSQEESCISSSWGHYIPGTITISHGTPTKINKIGVIDKVIILVEQATLRGM